MYRLRISNVMIRKMSLSVMLSHNWITISITKLLIQTFDFIFLHYWAQFSSFMNLTQKFNNSFWHVLQTLPIFCEYSQKSS